MFLIYIYIRMTDFYNNDTWCGSNFINRYKSDPSNSIGSLAKACSERFKRFTINPIEDCPNNETNMGLHTRVHSCPSEVGRDLIYNRMLLKPKRPIDTQLAVAEVVRSSTMSNFAKIGQEACVRDKVFWI